MTRLPERIGGGWPAVEHKPACLTLAIEAACEPWKGAFSNAVLKRTEVAHDTASTIARTWSTESSVSLRQVSFLSACWSLKLFDTSRHSDQMAVFDGSTTNSHDL